MGCLVSIITVVYNGEKYLRDTIESVINQTYENIEYIIIDGGSTDGTLKIIKKYGNKISRLISEPDNGIYDAMNKGIRLAKGELVGLINADDYYDIDAVKNAVLAFEEHGCDVVYGDKILLDEKNKIKKRFSVDEPKSMRQVNVSIVHPTVFVKKKVYEKIVFDDTYKICADRDMFYRIYNSGYQFKKIEKVIAIMRTGGVSSFMIKPVYEGFVIRKKYFGLRSAILFAIIMPLGHYKTILIKKLFINNIIKSDSWSRV
jgi:glycosyltransferase involved in cell wall biosynthesis